LGVVCQRISERKEDEHQNMFAAMRLASKKKLEDAVSVLNYRESTAIIDRARFRVPECF